MTKKKKKLKGKELREAFKKLRVEKYTDMPVEEEKINENGNN